MPTLLSTTIVDILPYVTSTLISIWRPFCQLVTDFLSSFLHRLLEKTAGSPSQRLAQQSSRGCRCSTAIYAGDLRSPGVTERRNGPLGLRDDDDVDCKEYRLSANLHELCTLFRTLQRYANAVRR